MKESGSDNNLSQWWRKQVSKWRVKAKLLLVPKEAKRPQALIKPEVTGTIADSTDIVEDFRFFVNKFTLLMASALEYISDLRVSQVIIDLGGPSIQSTIQKLSSLIVNIKSFRAMLKHYLGSYSQTLVINKPDKLLFLQGFRLSSINGFRVLKRDLKTFEDPGGQLKITVDELLQSINTLLTGMRGALSRTHIVTDNQDYVSFYGLEEITKGDIEVKSGS
jgi:hypothetical protein